MKIGITGATGQLGQLVVHSLKEKISADDIVALVRTPEKAASLGVEARTFEYNQPNLAEQLKDIDTFLLISSSEVGQRIPQHQNVVNLAQEAGVKRIVYTSLLKADTTNLGLSPEHLATEQAIEASIMDYTILKNGWYTENYTANVAGTVQAGTLIGSAGEGKIASATRQDFAEAAVAVLTTEGHTNKTYELAGDEAYTLADLAEELSKQSGKDIPYINLPEQEYSAAIEGFGVPKIYADMLANCDVCASKNDLFDDSKTLSQLIGRPTTSLADVVKSLLK